MSPGEEGGGAEVAKTKVAVGQGVAGGEQTLVLGSGELATCGADAHLPVESVGLTVFYWLSRTVDLNTVSSLK